MTGMGSAFVDSAACPRGTAPPCRDPKSRPLYYGRARHLRHAREAVANAAKMVHDDSMSMGQHREVVPVRLLRTGRTVDG